jgi:asparagine synthase (glutamine-hydrolysing)
MRRSVKLLETAHDVDASLLENSRYCPAADFDRLCPGSRSFPAREAMLARARDRSASVIGKALYFDQRTYLPSLLMRLDKTSMASGVECRVPFLDYRIVEWSAHLPDSQKIRAARATKVIVKRLAARYLPRAIVHRDKVGFGTPVGRWFRNPRGLGRYLDLLTDRTFAERGFFDAGTVQAMVEEHRADVRNHDEALWALMNLELWCRTFIDPAEPGFARPAGGARETIRAG